MTDPDRVLVAEDQALVAMQIETELEEAGLEVIGPFETCKDASAWLDTDTPDVAVLDLHLKDGPCIDVAATLMERHVPFVALTGADTRHIPDVLKGAPLIEKPSDLAKLPRVLKKLIRAESSGGDSCGSRGPA